MLDVAGGPRGSPGASGVGGQPRVFRARVLWNPPPEPGVGEPPGALSQKGAEGAGSRGRKMLLGPLEGKVRCVGPGFLQRLTSVGVHSGRVPASPSSRAGWRGLQGGVRDCAPSFPTFSVLLVFTQIAESPPWNHWLL